MTIKSKRHVKGIITKPTTAPAAEEGEQRTDSSSNEQKVYLGGEERTVITNNQTQTLTNKSIGDTNTIEAQDDAFSIHNAADDTKTLEFDIVYNDPNVKTTLRTLSSQTADKVFVFPKVLPDVDVDELLSESSDSQLSNKYMLSSCTYEILENKLTIFDQASSTRSLKFAIESDANSETTLAANSTGDRTLTLPDATDTLVGKETEDTLENKTIDATATGTNTLSADAVDIIYNNTDSPRLTDINVKAALDSTDANLTTITGIGPSDLDLGAFNGTTISNNVNIRTALQELEDAHEDHKDNPTGVHNVVGDVVGTKGNQTIQQKDLDQSNLITGTYLSEAGVSTIRIKNENSTSSLYFNCTQTTSGRSTTLETGNIPFEVGDITITLPNNTTTLVGTDTPQQLSNKVLKDELTFTEIGTPVPTPDINKVVLYPKADGKFYKKSSDGKEEELGAGGGGATSFEINQLAHGFAVGEGIYHDAEAVGGAKFDKAQADNANTLAYYVVTEVIDNDTFVASDFGRIQVTKPSHGYNAGDFHFLSTDILTSPTVTSEPTSGFSNPLFYVEEVVDPNTVILQVKVYRPSAVSQEINLDDLGDVDTTTTTPNNGDILEYNDGTWTPVAPSVSGEANTASNLGTGAGGIGLFTAKSGVDLPFKSLVAGTNITLDSGADTVTINSTGGGGASALDDLSDVTITSTPGTGEVLAYNGSQWVPTTVTSGGGGATVIVDGGNIDQATYEGDVLLAGNANLTITTVIKGNLYFLAESTSLDNQDAGHSLTVHGSVHGTTDTNNHNSIKLETVSVNNQDAGSFTCYGSVYNTEILTRVVGLNPSRQPGVPGNVYITGDFLGLNCSIIADGGTSDVASPPSNGGTVFIGGNAFFKSILSRGGWSSGTCNYPAANGGTVTINGSARAENSSTSVNLSGGFSNTGFNAGNGGNFLVRSNAIIMGSVSLSGGDASGAVSDGGNGGVIFLYGDSYFGNSIVSNGGSGTQHGGNGPSQALFYGHMHITGIFSMFGGNGAGGNGGNAASNITFNKGFTSSSIAFGGGMRLYGGSGSAGFSNGSTVVTFTSRGDSSAYRLDFSESGDGTDPSTLPKVRFYFGNYNMGEFITPTRGVNPLKIEGYLSTLNINSLSGSTNTFYNGTTQSPVQTNVHLYTYKFRENNGNILRSSAFTVL